MTIGILAHVDAGKTTLTERLLYDTGVIDRVGSVDKGSTQTDSLDLERRRGITIQSAVVSFRIGDVQVNLIDTPGHSDFIAEVERALHVLDGAVLVVSAVEGVQAQTRVLLRTLTRLGIPAVIFANKIDRMGARYGGLLEEFAAKLTPSAVAMNAVDGIGTRDATVAPSPRRVPDHVVELLADRDETFLVDYLDGAAGPRRVHAELKAQARRGLVHPVFFGSAATGVGVAELLEGIREFLPASEPPAEGPPTGSVFKIERGRAGEKLAFVRMRLGTLRPRTPVTWYRRGAGGAVTSFEGRVTGVRVFDGGVAATRADAAHAGSIAKVTGLKEVAIGDEIGTDEGLSDRGLFTPPTLETEVSAAEPGGKPALHAALTSLAERDPFINVRADAFGALHVSLYGEVQKEVIAAMLAEEFGVEARFADSRTIYVERLTGTGESEEHMGVGVGRYFIATMGLRVESGPEGSGVVYRLGIERGMLQPRFHTTIEETVRETLRQGPYGWQVTDCVVTLTLGGYLQWSSSTGAFRQLTPLVLADAVKAAGTEVCEPISRYELEVPGESAAGVLVHLGELGAQIEEQVVKGETSHLAGTLPARRVHDLERRLPSLTRGEGVLFTSFAGYRRVAGRFPVRDRTDGNPYNRDEYLMHALKVV